MDASLVGAPDFKPARGVLTLSQIGSIPMHLRQITDIIKNGKLVRSLDLSPPSLCKNEVSFGSNLGLSPFSLMFK